MRDKKHSWYETYELQDKEPYGAMVMYQMLKTYFPDKELTVLDKPLHESLVNEGKQNSNYIFIGENMFLKSIRVCRRRKSGFYFM